MSYWHKVGVVSREAQHLAVAIICPAPWGCCSHPLLIARENVSTIRLVDQQITRSPWSTVRISPISDCDAAVTSFGYISAVTGNASRLGDASAEQGKRAGTAAEMTGHSGKCCMVLPHLRRRKTLGIPIVQRFLPSGLACRVSWFYLVCW